MMWRSLWARRVGQLLPKRGTPSQNQGIVPGPEEVVKLVEARRNASGNPPSASAPPPPAPQSAQDSTFSLVPANIGPLYQKHGQQDHLTRHPTFITTHQPGAGEISAEAAQAMVSSLSGTPGAEKPEPHTGDAGIGGTPVQEVRKLHAAGVPDLVSLQELGFPKGSLKIPNPRLELVGSGVESRVFTPRQPTEGHKQMVYKVLATQQDAEPWLGLRSQMQVNAAGKLQVDETENYSANDLRKRYYYQSSIGGTPTEIAGATYDGFVVLKQPFAVVGETNKPDILKALRNAGAVPIPTHLIADPKNPKEGHKRLAIVTVNSIPLLVSDLHEGNVVFDGARIPRLNDVAITELPSGILKAIPALNDLVSQARALEQKNPNRSAQKFVRVNIAPSKTLPAPSAPSDAPTERLHAPAPKPADPGTTKRIPLGTTRVGP
jgi:hypothetical protein